MKQFLVKVRGIPPYIALARSSCDAINQAIAIHEARGASARLA